MPISPEPFKYVCPKCGYSKIVRFKSDIINPLDLNSICPRCNSKMVKKELNMIEKMFFLNGRRFNDSI